MFIIGKMHNWSEELSLSIALQHGDFANTDFGSHP